MMLASCLHIATAWITARRCPAGGQSRDGPASVPELDHAGSPQPPPPGVSIRRTSPALSWIVHFSGRRSARASSPDDRSQFSPGAPGPPPARPHGCDTRRSVMSDTVASSSTWRSRSMPSPPADRPAPPLPRRRR
jgi:hypothetical protein